MTRTAAAALVAMLASPPAAGELLEVPHPQLDEFKPEIRTMLTGARGRFELTALDAEGQQLGVAFGRLGVHYYAHAVQDAARACFENATLLDPDNHRWPYYLGVHYAETGDFEQAIERFGRVLSLAPGDIPAMTRLGLVLLELNRLDDAERHFLSVPRADAANAPALAGLARVAENRDDWAGAVGLYREALEAQPEASQLHYRLGLAYRQLGEVDKAKTHLERRGPRIPRINDPLLQLMNAHTRPAVYYMGLGDRMLAEGQGERAWNYYDVARAIDPGDAGALAGMARILFLTGRADEARAAVDRALGLEPDSAPALVLKGQLEQRDGALQDAAALYERALAFGAQAQTRFRLANLLMRIGQFERARDHYDALADSEAYGVEAKYRAGIASVAGGDCQTAEKRFLAAYRADPGMGKVIQALARVYATCLDATDEQRATALEYAKMLYDGQPSLETSETLAMTLAANEQFDDAIDFQAQAIFEALKSGVMDAQPQLRENMDRYRSRQPARLPWPGGHAVFSLQ